MNMSRFEMRIPLSSSVILSNMVVLLFTFVAPSAVMWISILFGCTLISSTFPSFVSFYATPYPSTNRCSTPFLFDFHIPKMMVNAMVISLPTTECLALQHSPFFSTFFFLFFSMLFLLPLLSVCVHFSMLPFPLLLSTIFLLCSPHSFF